MPMLTQCMHLNSRWYNQHSASCGHLGRGQKQKTLTLSSDRACVGRASLVGVGEVRTARLPWELSCWWVVAAEGTVVDSTAV